MPKYETNAGSPQMVPELEMVRRHQADVMQALREAVDERANLRQEVARLQAIIGRMVADETRHPGDINRHLDGGVPAYDQSGTAPPQEMMARDSSRHYG